MKRKLEICVDNCLSVRNAIAGGADRLELCSALSEGGLTPTVGLARQVKKLSDKIQIFAMIRIRCGNFVYDEVEMEAMMEDVAELKKAGVDGFVFGALKDSNEINFEQCERMVSAAQPLPVTFHRAFDQTIDPKKVVDQLVSLGFSRILTSGQEKSARYGLSLITELVEYAGDRIIIMPGAGITTGNLAEIIEKSKAREFHASCKGTVISSEENKISVGTVEQIAITDRRIVQNLKSLLCA